MESESSRVSQALKQCQDIQHMIDITSQHLERLRSTFSNAGDELTLQEIRTLEGKLIKQFSEQLAVKYGLGSHAADLVYFPSLSQWLMVVGVSGETYDAIQSTVRSLEELKDKTECELKRILLTSSRVSSKQIPEDLRRLCRSLLSLRKYTDALMYGHKMYGPNQDPAKLELHWDSWDRDLLSLPSPRGDLASSPKHDTKTSGEILRSVPVRLGPGKVTASGGESAASSLSSSSSMPPPSPGYLSQLSATLSPPSMEPPRTTLITPPATPPWALLTKDPRAPPSSAGKSSQATPPAAKKHSTGVGSGPQSNISKSKSHEAELAHRVDLGAEAGHGETVDSSGYSSSSEAPNSVTGQRGRLPSSDPESGLEMCPVPSPIASPKSPAPTSLTVPRSPRTPGPGSAAGNNSLNVSINRPMTHTIAHRFTKTFKPARCDFCQEYFFQGLKCKECKFRCHTQCESSVPPSCGLPEQFLDYFFEHITNTGSPSMPRIPPPIIHSAPFDSSSSSCNSSTPSSPHVIVTTHPDTGTPSTPWSAARRTPHGPGTEHFKFPEPRGPLGHGLTMTRISVSSEKSFVSTGTGVDTIISNKSNDSDKTLSGSSDRSDSIGTAYRLDSQVCHGAGMMTINPMCISGLDHKCGGRYREHLVLGPADVHQGVGHSAGGTQGRGQDRHRPLQHSARRQLARRRGDQVPRHGERGR